MPSVEWKVRKKMPTLTWIALLDCGHTIAYSEPRPQMNDEILCVKGNHVARVKWVEREYFTMCTSCLTPARRFGTDLEGAKRYAEKHAGRFPYHHVYVMRGTTIFKAWKPTGHGGSMLVDLFGAKES